MLRHGLDKDDVLRWSSVLCAWKKDAGKKKQLNRCCEKKGLKVQKSRKGPKTKKRSTGGKIELTVKT